MQQPQQPPPKPLRKKAQRRKIRLSASRAELLSTGEGEDASLLMPSVTDGMFEDLWGVDGPSPSPNVMRDGQRGKEGQQEKVLLTPEEGSGAAAALIPDGELR